MFNNDRIRKHVTHFKTLPFHFHVDVINVWSIAPQTFKTNYLAYLSVVLRFQKQSWNWKISKICKTKQVFFLQPRSRNTRIDFYYYLFIYCWQKKCYTTLNKKKLIIVTLIKIFYIYLDCTWNIQNHLCILKIKFKKFAPIPKIHSALGIRGITEKLRKLRAKSRQKAWPLFVRVETNLNFTKLAEKWFMAAWQLQELIEIGLPLLRCISDIWN